MFTSADAEGRERYEGTFPCNYGGWVPPFSLHMDQPYRNQSVDVGGARRRDPTYHIVEAPLAPRLMESIPSMHQTLRPQLEELCQSHAHSFAPDWSPIDCLRDLQDQVESWVTGVCGGLLVDPLPPSTAAPPLSSPPDTSGAQAGASSRATSGRAAAPRDQCLIVHHVPKTAGNSLLAWLQMQRLAVWAHYKPHLPSAAGRPHLNADVYIGHWAVSPSAPAHSVEGAPASVAGFLASRGMGRRCHDMTVLRRPLERAASALFFLEHRRLLDAAAASAASGGVGEGASSSFESRAAALTELMEGVATHPRGGNYSNFMCRFFSGLAPTWDALDVTFLAAPGGGAGLGATAYCSPLAARASLRALSHVGFTEDLEATKERVAELLGFRPAPADAFPTVPADYKWNPSENPEAFSALPARLRELIEASNREDVGLYAWARREFGRATSA